MHYDLRIDVVIVCPLLFSERVHIPYSLLFNHLLNKNLSRLLRQQRKQVRSHVIIVMSILGCTAQLVITLILFLLFLNEERTCIQAHMLICNNGNQEMVCTREMSRCFGTLSIPLIISAPLAECSLLSYKRNSSAALQNSAV